MMPWMEIAGIAALFAICIAASAYAKRSDYRLGREAQRNGLALNPKWSRAMREGWSGEFFDSINREIAVRSAEAKNSDPEIREAFRQGAFRPD